MTPQTPGLPTTQAAAPPEWDDAAVLDSRPRIRRDILFTEVPDGALFHDASTGFRLRGTTAYRFATLLVPFLTGEHRVVELSAGLGDTQRAMVVSLVRSLYERGFARPVPAPAPSRTDAWGAELRRRFAAQIAYVDHHVDDAEDRFLRFRETSVAVLGDDEVARWCALGLVRNGAATVGVAAVDGEDAGPDRFADVEREALELTCDGGPVDIRRIPRTAAAFSWAQLESYDVVVVTPAAGPAQVLALLEGNVPAGRRLLPVWVLGGVGVVGPSTATGEAGCWTCAALRLGANADPAAAADFWSGVVAGAPVPAMSRPVAGMLGNLAAYEIFRIATRALPAETEGRVVVQDLDSLDVSVEPLQPHPRCPHCGSAASAAALLSQVGGVEPHGVDEPSLGFAERAIPEPGNPEADEVLRRLAKNRVMVQPHVGVVSAFADEPLTQLPLRVSAVDLAVGPARRRIAAVDVHNVATARVAALTAAAAVYADRVVPLPAARPVALRTVPRVPVAALETATGLPGGDPTTWVPATSLSTGRQLLVPAAAAEPFGPHNRDRVCAATSAGLGVDVTAALAGGVGLLSALAYDAAQDAVRGRCQTAVVDLGPDLRADLGDPVLTFLTRSAANLDVDVELLELGDPRHQPAPVLLARCADPSGAGTLWAIGSHPSWRVAAAVALRDLVGRVQLSREPGFTSDTVDTGDPLLADLDAAAVPVSGRTAPRLGYATTMPYALARLRGSGRDAAVVTKTSADLAAAGMVAARVLTFRTSGGH
jgi:bacteriocin biosynthesis cyclodehydratase domain-containing protein